MGRREQARSTKPRIRPTSALVRGALFNRLGERIVNAGVLDLFAGTGALGIEALRRGATRVVFVDRNAKVTAAIRAALAREGFAHRAEVWRRDALAALRELGATRRRFEVIILDPPYGEGWIPRTLHTILQTDTLSVDGVVIAEGHWRDRPAAVPGLAPMKEARYGETVLWYFERHRGGQNE